MKIMFSIIRVQKSDGDRKMFYQVVMSNEVELPVRQAAVIYLKNMVSGNLLILLHLSCSINLSPSPAQ